MATAQWADAPVTEFKMAFNIFKRQAAVRAVALAGLVPLIFAIAGPAEARIKCVNGYQIVNGSPIATPYCQDELVAHVARGYGIKVSAATIRNNPNIKRDVCRNIGRDNRIFIACIDANPVGRRAF
jgi:hypothetical protein